MAREVGPAVCLNLVPPADHVHHLGADEPVTATLIVEVSQTHGVDMAALEDTYTVMFHIISHPHIPAEEALHLLM